MELIGSPRCRAELKIGFEESGSKDVVVDDYSADGLTEQSGYGALSRTWRTRHLDEEFRVVALYGHDASVLARRRVDLSLESEELCFKKSAIWLKTEGLVLQHRRMHGSVNHLAPR